ncbi:MAG: DUF5916 domain-containing protein [Bacteroidota bacterium]
MTVKYLSLLLTLCWLCAPDLCGQEMGEDTPFAFAKKTTESIQIDGQLDEAIWQQLSPADAFWQYFPEDSTQAISQTELYMAYDDENLYVAARCHALGRQYVVPSLRRDYQAGGSDNLTLVFDTFNDRTNAFVFGLNPYGVQREALISNGGINPSRDWDTSWDNQWKGESKMGKDGWTAEFSIPFKTLRFKEGGKRWRFNSYRFDTQANERSTWVRIPRNQIIINLAYMGTLEWEEPLGKAGQNMALIPYATAGADVDFQNREEPWGKRFAVGADGKVAITSGLNLDLTINPDFSQVEVDEQVVDLSRFEILFPERRQFFLENADLFSSFGSRRTTPFFSRRIGVGQDTSTDQTIQNTIYYGARLSGKLDNNWRIGLLNMQTARDTINDLPSFNHTVAAVQRRMFKGSSLGAIFVNRQKLGSRQSESFDSYNRVVGLDYNIASGNGRWGGKIFLHKSMTAADSLGNQLSHGFRVNYVVRRFSFDWRHSYVGEDFDAQLGFVRRKNIFRIHPTGRLFFYPKRANSLVNLHVLGGQADLFWQPDGRKTDHNLELFWNINFINTSRLNVSLRNQYTYLFDEFDPTGLDGLPLPEGTEYSYTRLNVSYNSDRRRAVSFSIRPSIGQFYNGMRYNIGGSLNFRFQPVGALAINVDYNYIDLPSPRPSASLLIFRPRLDLTFSKRLFLTTFFQFNDQIDNVNLNIRLQYRFRPVSDFFLVYTDNYTTGFDVKTRAIVAKFSYWLNL